MVQRSTTCTSMGPPPFGSGNEHGEPPALHHADTSMGPPPFGSGNEGLRLLGAIQQVTSMGPPPFGSGNHAQSTEAVRDALTSMGPPPFGSGNVSTVEAVDHRLSSTEVGLQWGHRLSVVETARERGRRRRLGRTSMGPPPFGSGNCPTRWTWCPSVVLQWGHRLSVVETPQSTRPNCQVVTNGATAFR